MAAALPSWALGRPTHHQRLELASQLGKLILDRLLLGGALATARAFPINLLLDLLYAPLVLDDCGIRWRRVGAVITASRAHNASQATRPLHSLDCCRMSIAARVSVSSGRTGRGIRLAGRAGVLFSAAPFSTAGAASTA